MTLVLKEAEFRTSHTKVVRFHSQLPGTLDDESLIVPYLAIQLYPTKIILTEVIVAFYFFNNISVETIPSHHLAPDTQTNAESNPP